MNHVKLVARKEAVITAAFVVAGNTITMDVNTSFREMPRGYRHRAAISLRSENVPPFICNCCQKPESEDKFKQCKGAVKQ